MAIEVHASFGGDNPSPWISFSGSTLELADLNRIFQAANPDVEVVPSKTVLAVVLHPREGVAMTRVELQGIFYTVARALNWHVRAQDA